jgi:hypothetical protein
MVSKIVLALEHTWLRHLHELHLHLLCLARYLSDTPILHLSFAVIGVKHGRTAETTK